MKGHKLIRQGTGAKLWGQCECDCWCWLGTYHFPKGRLVTLRREHATHLAYVATGGLDEAIERARAEAAEKMRREKAYDLEHYGLTSS